MYLSDRVPLGSIPSTYPQQKTKQNKKIDEQEEMNRGLIDYMSPSCFSCLS